MVHRILALVLTFSVLTGCSIDIADTRPEPNRFSYSVVANGLDEPLQLEFDRQGRVYWIERNGMVKRINESTDRIDELGSVSIYNGDAPGLIGFLLDKNFEKTRHLYLYYSAAGDSGNMRLSRFTLGSDETIDMDSEVVLLEIPWEQPDGDHFGGGMTWDEAGNLYLSVGDDTKPSQYESIHYLNEDDSMEVFDAARTAGNTNDLRGTILRITPRQDGSYTIPDGNLFAEGPPNTRPEIYIMGNRNPWRLSIDSQTGYLHWGEVGPDSGVDSEQYGPMGYDEFNVARQAGNFGWPFIVGKNRPYNRYDYESRTYGDPHNPQTPVNTSPNNTGLRELPPAQPSLVAYPYQVSEQWPILGSGARSVVGGPLFRRADFSAEAPRVFPDYYEGKWLVTDYVRNWIMVITMDEERTEATDIEPMVPADRLAHKQPLDMDFGPSGDLYLVEYGAGGQGQIAKYKYNAGNRAPLAQASAERASGPIPFEVMLSPEGTVDYDGDELSYRWEVRAVSGGASYCELTGPDPVVTLEQPGRYNAVLTVSDPEGATDRDSVEIVAGNERPEVNIEITQGNRSFYFPDDTIGYQVQVRDHEDGSLADGSIPADRVRLVSEYVPSGLSASKLAELQAESPSTDPPPLQYLQAQNLIAENNCETCHRTNEVLVGPSFTDVAEKYAGTDRRPADLARSILEGSVGRWGATPMPPQAMLSETEATQIAEYILSLARPESESGRLPLKGRYITEGQEGAAGDRLGRFFSPDHEMGSYVLRAWYTDEGSEEVKGLSLSGRDEVLLRYPLLPPQSADVFSEEGISYTPSTEDPGFIVSGPEPYIGFEQLDLTGINQINIGALTRYWHWSHFMGAEVELRLGGPEGPLVGAPHGQFQPDTLRAVDGPFFGDQLDSPVEINVSDVSGIHDVYIVFRNGNAENEDALLLITGIEFKQ